MSIRSMLQFSSSVKTLSAVMSGSVSMVMARKTGRRQEDWLIILRFVCMRAVCVGHR